MQKLLGQNAAWQGRSLQLGLRKIRWNGAKPELDEVPSFSVNLDVKLSFISFGSFSAMKNVGKPYDRVCFHVHGGMELAVNKLAWRLSCEQSIMLAWKTDFVLNANPHQDTETQVPPALNELHRSSVQMIAACTPLAPTYDLHVAQFYETVAR